jgi:hypothetical protein
MADTSRGGGSNDESSGGLRARLRRGLRRAVDRLSGEHSAVAPESREGYRRPGVPNDEANVVMARLNRPAGGGDEG